MKVFAVIIAGGSGERLWPLSTPEHPKQFVTLFGGKPLIRHAMDRLSGLVPPERTLVVTAKSLVSLTRKALPALPKTNILAEPCRRNTAPAIALAVCEAKRRGGPDAVCCILTADQLMEPASEFRKALKKAIAIAAKGEKIVTLGIKPTYAATGFGYIDTAAEPPCFIEKPDAKKAARFLKKGTYLWNSGMFIFRVDRMESALREFAPDTARLLGAKNWKKIYPSLESVSIDYAVMEKTKDIAVVPASFRWDDVGSWNSVPNRFEHDADDNTRLGKTAVYDTKGSVIVSTADHLAAVVGLKDVVVVHTDKVTLVCAKSKAQDIKKLLMKTVLSLSFVFVLSATLFAERQPFDRYQPIVDRQMFGPVPEGFDPTKPPSEVQKTTSRAEAELQKEKEKIKSAIRFSAINVTPSGEVAVGFTDSSDPKEIANYYLKVGEERNGWLVKAADPLKATMTIVKGDITIDLELGGNSGQGAGNAARNQPGAVIPGNRPAGSALPARQIGLGNDTLNTIRARRDARLKLRQEEAAVAAEEKAKAEEAAAKAAEEKAQIKQELANAQEDIRKMREEAAAERARKEAEAAEKAAAAKAAEEHKSSESDSQE